MNNKSFHWSAEDSHTLGVGVGKLCLVIAGLASFFFFHVTGTLGFFFFFFTRIFWILNLCYFLKIELKIEGPKMFHAVSGVL